MAALSALLAPALALSLAACDAAGPGADPVGPDPVETITGDQAAIVALAFEDVESLFSLGFNDGNARAATRAAEAGSLPAALASVNARVDTTTYTGVYDGSKGYLVQLTYRRPQGVGVWGARVQHARSVDHDADGGTTPELDAVETIQLSFLTYADLEAFVAALGAGTLGYFTDASDDAEAGLGGYDTWRVTQVYSPAEGEAVVAYANAELRESIAVRDPVVTQNADGTGNVRDGGPGGAVRTRYYGADFSVDADGSVSGTHLRTLLSSGDTSSGALTSRSTDEVAGTWRQTRQRGGDGVVVRENTEG
ncbi:hypothetical protein RQM47_16010 [Rubrivirga sp. S365]|uniref:hypothetical protein n=1 Tax=Rubrivirga sp. S365 TaxID=3076080 RepID=UPI0028C7A658|nr:hypothetical protein [Rubrivirga sp. S365]MDT7858153.1 hypothetical protein [Rubrivirga sp. S365]